MGVHFRQEFVVHDFRKCVFVGVVTLDFAIDFWILHPDVTLDIIIDI